ncbi:hypothetical protein Q2T40_04550 [Winogradskyella maritima]|nr:hypothetical protein [Winogradskyella maritima]
MAAADDMQAAFDKGLQYHYKDKDSAYFTTESFESCRRGKGHRDQVLVLSYLLNANSNFYDLPPMVKILVRQST